MSEALLKQPSTLFFGIEDYRKTLYGKALAGKDKNDDRLMGPEYVYVYSAVCATLSFCGFIAAIIACVNHDASWLMIPLLGIGPLVPSGLIILVRHRKLKREFAKIFSDPVLRFEWVLARAIEIHKLRVRAYYNLIKGVDLGVASADEEALQGAHEFLLRSEEFLNREIEIYKYAQEGREIAGLVGTEKPELFDALRGLAEAENALRTHIAEMAPGGNSPVAKILDNEASRLELEAELQGLLPVKTG